MRMRIILMLAMGAAAIAAVGGCREAADLGGRLPVTATTTQVGDFVREVGGGRVAVTQILRPNSDPHEYEPRPSDAASLNGAKLVFRSGGDVDDWLSGVIKQAGGGARVVTLSDSVATLPGAAQGEIDPHWWQDPRNAEAAVGEIRDQLVMADPAHAAAYRRNASAYLARLGRLDGAVARCIDRVPPAQRKLVTSHDAFGYYTRRYGIDLIGTAIPSRSTQAEPSGASISRLVALVEREHVNAIFPETSVNTKLEQAISSETGAHFGRPLWGDTLGPPGSDGATYIDSLSSNTDALVDGFTGGHVHCRPSA